MTIRWEVNKFSLVTSTVAGVSDTLYANGRMQVIVYVQFLMVDQNGKPLYLSSSDIDSLELKLVDYYNTSSVLGGDWSAGEHDYGFVGSLSSAASVADRGDSQLDDGSQYKKFLVSTTQAQAGNKVIAASMTIQHEDEQEDVITTNNGEFDSHVTLTAIPRIDYIYPSNVTLDSETVTSGTYKVDLTHGTAAVGFNDPFINPWNQVNYYLSTNNHALSKAKIGHYDSTGYNGGRNKDKRLAGCYTYKVLDDNSLCLHFIWNHDESTRQCKKIAGFVRANGFPKAGEGGTVSANAYEEITINQRQNSLCLTCLQFMSNEYLGDIWGYQWRNTATIELYDIYGNAGYFTATVDDFRNSVAIKNSNP